MGPFQSYLCSLSYIAPQKHAILDSCKIIPLKTTKIPVALQLSVKHNKQLKELLTSHNID